MDFISRKKNSETFIYELVLKPKLYLEVIKFQNYFHV
jgi:hypothetical protein